VPLDNSNDDISLWGPALAARLRLIQAGFTDEDAATRQAFLAEEVERALKPITPSRKRQYLEAVSNYFPAWQPEVQKVEPAPQPTLENVVGQLVAFAPEINDEMRMEIARQLIAAKIIPETASPAPAAHYGEFWRKFGLEAEKPPHHERALRLLMALSEFFLALDQLSWALWRTIGAKSAYRKEWEFSKLAGPYLSGDPEVSTEQMRQLIERTRKLVAALSGAPGRAGSDVAAKHAGIFSPEVIEAAARLEKRALESLDSASWRDYKQRYHVGGAAPHLEAAIQSAVAQAAEDLIGGRVR